MPVTGIDHVQLAAPEGCEAAAREFFGGLLGLQEIPKAEGVRDTGGAWFRCGAQELHVGVQAGGFVPAAKAHPGLTVAGAGALERLAARLGKAGHPVSWDARIAGVRRFYTADPWGNRIELRSAAVARPTRPG